MWSTNSLWFEVAIVSLIFAIGNMTMGHFEERTPKVRRVGKFLFIVIIVCLISSFAGRTYAMSFLALSILPILYIHGYYLPKKKGINGWTGEPKSRYYDFRGWDKNIF
jgi:Ca2+/Na+ antiporter